MKIDPHKYTSAFEKNIRKRFENASSVKIRKIERGYNSDYAVDWPYLGVEYKVNFYVNGEKRLNFFIELEFERKNGLREKLEDVISGSKIEKSSFLNKPEREYFDSEEKEFHKHHLLEEQKKLQGVPIGGEKIRGYSIFKEYVDMLEGKKLIRKGKDYYFISCRIKRIPENPNVLVNALFGGIIAPIYSVIMHSFRDHN